MSNDEIKTIIAKTARATAAAMARQASDWRERVWTAPAETVMTVDDVCSATGRTRAFVYRHTRNRTIKFKRLDGAICFRCGDVREWIKERQEAA